MESDVFQLMQELIDQQKEKLLLCARRIRPNATADDILQPNDYPELEQSAVFRYEEGILDGLQVARSSLSCLMRQSVSARKVH